MADGEHNIEEGGYDHRQSRLGHFFAIQIWPRDRSGFSRFKAAYYRLARVLALAAYGFVKNRAFYRASALSFIAILSLVPLLAFAFSVAKQFGVYDDLIQHTIVPFLDSTFGPARITQLGPANAQDVRYSIDKLLGFISQTNVTSLGLVGLLILLVTAVELLASVEDSFNSIWRVNRSRPLARKVANYTSVIAVAPILLITVVGMTAALQTNTSFRWLKDVLHLKPLLNSVPLVISGMSLVLVYRALPNARVNWRSAIYGGIVAGSLWQLGQIMHLKSQISLARYNALYASFAAAPIFLVWLYLCWITLLIGAEIAAAHQHEPGYRRPPWLLPADQAFRERLTLRVMYLVGCAFQLGKKPLTINALSKKLSVYDAAIEDVLSPLISHGLIALSGEKDRRQVLLTRELDSVRMKTILDIIKRPKRSMMKIPWKELDPVEETLAQLDAHLERAEANVTLKTLIEKYTGDDTPPPPVDDAGKRMRLVTDDGHGPAKASNDDHVSDRPSAPPSGSSDSD